MIHHLDNLLRHLFLAQIAEITSEDQVGFQPPDEEWRGHVTNLEGNALNIYLVDLRENRQLRSNERVRAVQNGIVSETPAPRRVDCHYLITAWSPAETTPAVEPTLDEHTLLAEVTGILMQNESLIPREVYAPNPLPATFPPEVADAELPTSVLPVEGFLKLAEFWGTMGANHRWKPAVYLVVTIPVILRTEIAGPMVTTRITEYRHTGKPETAEVWIQIGGHVLTGSLPQTIAVGSATVTAVSGTTVTVDNAGPFRVGDTVTENNLERATVTQILSNNITLDAPLPGLTINDTLRIANIPPVQATLRVMDVTGLHAGGMALISGDDATNPGTIVTDRAVIQHINPSTGFVTLSAAPARAHTYNVSVAAVNTPTLTPLNTLAEAWVRLEDTSTGAPVQTTATNADGRFTFASLHAGDYTLRARVQGFAEATLDIEVPSVTGSYDVILM
jgi:hypothetical protein